ncbi:MAG: DUF4870 domain-containing protein [Microbacteriaceae bacterium]|nr:DUF4870 domain-containing protein [Microbacteriaceae bacterium]
MSYTPPPAEPMNAREERQWSVLTHVIAGGINVISAGLFTGLIAAVVMYIIWKDRGPFIRGHVTSTLNFQITLIIAEIVAWILTATVILSIIGVPLIIAIIVLNIVFSIMGALAANRGEPYTYPLSIKFFK